MNNNIILYQATDLHYISPELTDNGTANYELMKNTDGKLIHYITQITDAIIEEVIRVKPSAFILSGDITYNGERKSHIEIAELLKELVSEGIPVLVIPGNHDIDNERAYSFVQGDITPVQNISQEDFLVIYNELGYSKALSVDKESLSYCYPLTEDTWILMLDASKDKGYANNMPSISNNTLEWIEEWLIKAKEKQIRVMSVTHQNLLPHNQLFSPRCTIENGARLVKLYQEYGVTFNISGHMHIQHISHDKESNLYDVATNSVAVYPNHLGVIELTERIDGQGDFGYHSITIPMEAYAARHGIEDKNLLEFKQYSRELFYNNSYTQIWDSLSECELTGKEKERMAHFTASRNLDYFSGTLDASNEDWIENKEYILWKEKGANTFYYTYLSGILREKNIDGNQLGLLVIRQTGELD